MSYTTSSLSEYRSENLGAEVIEILEDDYKWICSSKKELDFIFPIALVVLMSMSVIKVLFHVMGQIGKPRMTYKHLDLRRGMDSDYMTDILTRRESVESVQNQDNLCPDKNIKNQKVEHITNLRNYLYQHDLTLHTYVLKKINHKRTDEELLEMYRTGELSKPLSTTHITFGEDLNRLLKEVLENVIDLKINKVTKETYIKVLNDDFLPIQNKLKELYNENIKIKFD